MALTIKVEGGTPKEDVPALCYRCSYAMIKTNSKLEDRILCTAMQAIYSAGDPIPVTEKVVRCNQFSALNNAPVYGKLAWIYGHPTKVGPGGSLEVDYSKKLFCPPGTRAY